ncbi:hypothetical protein B7463_g5479, partial [Scytalidium lignicola]
MTTSEARSSAAAAAAKPPEGLYDPNTHHSRSFDSLDTLVPKSSHQCGYCSNQNTRVSSDMAIVEQKRSYGIGGAGNIRRPSDSFQPSRYDEEGTSSRRRSSVWSTFTPTPGSSPEGKRASFMSFFKKRRASEPSNTVEETQVQFRDVDLRGK